MMQMMQLVVGLFLIAMGMYCAISKDMYGLVLAVLLSIHLLMAQITLSESK